MTWRVQPVSVEELWTEASLAEMSVYKHAGDLARSGKQKLRMRRHPTSDLRQRPGIESGTIKIWPIKSLASPSRAEEQM